MPKMDYFGSKSQKIAKRWRLRPQTPLPPVAGGFAPRPPLRLNDQRKCKTLRPLKLLGDAEAWQFWGKTKLIFSAPPCSKNVPVPLNPMLNPVSLNYYLI